MAYVVADPCIKCKYTDCVAVCPVECFQEGKNSLVINPDECIDCGACEPECPTTAIFEESALPAKWAHYKEINAVFAGTKPVAAAKTDNWPEGLTKAVKGPGFAVWPAITATKEAMPGADEAAKEEDKLKDFDPTGGA